MVKSADLDKITETVAERVIEQFAEKLTESWIDRIAQKVTESITAALELKFEDKLRDLNDKINEIGERINTSDNNVVDNTNIIQTQNEKIESLREENVELGEIITTLATRVQQLENTQHKVPSQKEIDELSERVEECTNRQLRQTLIIKGVPETREEQTWADTKRVLASTIATNVHTSEDNVYHHVLNRVHRGRPNPRKTVRDIYANVYQWEHCERLVEDFRKLNISGQTNIQVEYKYGPRTTWRRNQALMKRKHLKTSGEIMSGYVAYPARLYVKRPGATREDKYVMIQDFSKLEYNPDPFPVTADSGNTSADVD